MQPMRARPLAVCFTGVLPKIGGGSLAALECRVNSFSGHRIVATARSSRAASGEPAPVVMPYTPNHRLRQPRATCEITFRDSSANIGVVDSNGHCSRRNDQVRNI